MLYYNMKLSAYAKKLGVTYQTAWKWFHDGHLQGVQLPTGTIIIPEPDEVNRKAFKAPQKVAIYARVSSAENKTNLEKQSARLQDYCAAKGYQVSAIVKEVGSGINDSRPKLLRLLQNPEIGLIVVEHKDRLTRFGFQYITKLLEIQKRGIEVVNLVETGKEDLVQDFVSIITSFCARIYGQRRSKRKTEAIVAELRRG